MADALGPGWQVAVLTDRGLESAALFRAITARGFHPLMRVQAVGTFRPEGWHEFRPMAGSAIGSSPRLEQNAG